MATANTAVKKTRSTRTTTRGKKAATPAVIEVVETSTPGVVATEEAVTSDEVIEITPEEEAAALADLSLDDLAEQIVNAAPQEEVTADEEHTSTEEVVEETGVVEEATSSTEEEPEEVLPSVSAKEALEWLLAVASEAVRAGTVTPTPLHKACVEMTQNVLARLK